MCKKNLFIFMAIVCAFSTAQSDRLILHFDTNKTIVASDPENESLHEVITTILAKDIIFKWNGQDEESYYAYVTNNISKEFPNLACTSDEFELIRTEQLGKFYESLVVHPMLLARYNEDKARMLRLLKGENTSIFTSFFKLIAWLDENFPGKYSIHLRTFGSDLPDVISAIQQKSNLNFGMGRLGGNFSDEKELVEFYRQNYDALADFFMHEHCGMSDDYKRWKAHGFKALAGKTFPVDPANREVLSIFFDDNADDPDKPIICPLLPGGIVGNSDELIKTGHIVAVKTKEAILDQEYFVKKVRALINASCARSSHEPKVNT